MDQQPQTIMRARLGMAFSTLLLSTAVEAAWKVAPSLSLESGHTSNVRLSPDKDSARILNGSINVQAQRLAETSEARVLFGLGYTDYPGADDAVDSVDSQHLSLLLRRNGETSTFGVLGALRRDDLLRRVTDTSDLAGDETDGTADLTDDIEEIADTEQELGDLQNSDTEINSIDDQVRRTYLRVDPFTQLKLSDRNRLRLQYSFALRDYSSDGQRLRDSTRHTLSAQFSRDMSERDTLLAGVSASAFEPDDLRNSEYYQATVGWRHRPTQTTRLEGELGLTHVDSTGVSDTGVMIRLAGRAQMRFGKLSAELRRTVVPNAFGTVVETDHIRMQLQTDLGRRWRSKSELLYIGRETDEATSSDRDQVRFRQQFRRTINRNLSLAASYQYRWVDRTQTGGDPEADTDATGHLASVSVTYQPTTGRR